MLVAMWQILLKHQENIEERKNSNHSHPKKLSSKNELTQLAITCSKSTIKSTLGKSLKFIQT